MIKLAKLFEALQQLDKFKTDVEIIIDLRKTDHASERQSRHGSSNIISDDEIKQTVRKAQDKVIDALVFNTIDVGDEVIITNKSTDLNCVCAILQKYPNSSDPNTGLQIRVITVMRKKDFKSDNTGTYKLYV
jgi:hypothetical protein